MGALADRAKAQSKFLLLDKGEFVIVQYVGWKPSVNKEDPEKEDTIYEFKESGKSKFWTNSSAKIMKALDHANTGDWVKITRAKKIKADNTEDTSKSVYSAELLPGYDPKTGTSMGEAPKGLPSGTVALENSTPVEAVDPFKEFEETKIN